MYNLFILSTWVTKQFTETKTNIKIKAATFKGCHLKLAFKVRLWSRENNIFSVFLPFVEDSDKLVYCTFLCLFRFVTTQRYSFLQ